MHLNQTMSSRSRAGSLHSTSSTASLGETQGEEFSAEFILAQIYALCRHRYVCEHTMDVIPKVNGSQTWILKDTDVHGRIAKACGLDEWAKSSSEQKKLFTILLQRLIMPRPALSYRATEIGNFRQDFRLADIEHRIAKLESNQVVKEMISRAGDQLDVSALMFKTFMIAANTFVLGPVLSSIGGVVRTCLNTKGAGLEDDIVVTDEGTIQGKPGYVNFLHDTDDKQWSDVGLQLMKERVDDFAVDISEKVISELTAKMFTRASGSEENVFTIKDGDDQHIDDLAIAQSFEAMASEYIDGKNIKGKLILMDALSRADIVITPSAFIGFYNHFWSTINDKLLKINDVARASINQAISDYEKFTTNSGALTLYYLAKSIISMGGDADDRIKSDLITYLVENAQLRKKTYFNPLYYLRPRFWFFGSKKSSIQSSVDKMTEISSLKALLEPNETGAVARWHYTGESFTQVTKWAAKFKSDYEKFELQARKECVDSVNDMLMHCKKEASELLSAEHVQKIVLELKPLLLTKETIKVVKMADINNYDKGTNAGEIKSTAEVSTFKCCDNYY